MNSTPLFSNNGVSTKKGRPFDLPISHEKIKIKSFSFLQISLLPILRMYKRL